MWTACSPPPPRCGRGGAGAGSPAAALRGPAGADDSADPPQSSRRDQAGDPRQAGGPRPAARAPPPRARAARSTPGWTTRRRSAGVWAASFKRGFRVPLQSLLGGEDQQVLRVPPPHARVVPDPAAQAVHRDVPQGREALRPVLRPLLVDVVDAPLPRDRRGEEDHRRERSSARGRGGPPRRRGCARRLRERKRGRTARRGEVGGEVEGAEAVTRDEQLLRRDPRPVHAAGIRDAAVHEDPGAMRRCRSRR